jgi:hypothetical protein
MTQRLRREVRLPIYWLAVGMAVMVISPLLSIFAAVKITDNRADQARREAAANQEAAQIAARKVVCGWIDAFLNTYDETPPTTEAGRNLQARFIDLYAISQCQPPRK